MFQFLKNILKMYKKNAKKRVLGVLKLFPVNKLLSIIAIKKNIKETISKMVNETHDQESLISMATVEDSSGKSLHILLRGYWSLGGSVVFLMLAPLKKK